MSNPQQSSVRKNIVIDVKQFCEMFPRIGDNIEELEPTMKRLETYADLALANGDDVSEEIGKLRDALTQLANFNSDSVEERHQLYREVRAVRDELVQRFGDA